MPRKEYGSLNIRREAFELVRSYVRKNTDTTIRLFIEETLLQRLVALGAITQAEALELLKKSHHSASNAYLYSDMTSKSTSAYLSNMTDKQEAAYLYNMTSKNAPAYLYGMTGKQDGPVNSKQKVSEHG